MRFSSLIFSAIPSWVSWKQLNKTPKIFEYGFESVEIFEHKVETNFEPMVYAGIKF